MSAERRSRAALKSEIEFDRLANIPAGMVVAKNSSDRLKQILGTYKIADNDVFATYTALMQQFGEDFETRESMFSIEAAGRGGEVAVADAVSAKVLRVLSNANSSYFYPAVDEAVQANARKIPRGMKYYYDIACKDDDAASGSVCRNPLATTQYFWRSMRADDVTSYSERTRAWNKKFGSIDDQGPFEVPNALKLVNYLAGTSWPEDFVILTGTANQDGCLAGFSYSLPQVMLEIALITNLTDRPLAVDNLFGGHSIDTRLRVLSPSATARLASAGDALEPAVGTLAPKETVVVPVRIYLAPNHDAQNLFRYRQTASQTQKRLGTNGFSGNGSFGAPSFKTYVYGPEVAIGGISINGERVDLQNRSANYMEMTMSAEEGSCPYPLSQGAEGSDWIDHGKILHAAPSQDREYTDVRNFSGFRARFRIEEREPEAAFINRAELTVVLKDGRTISLTAGNGKPAAGVGHRRLFWGQSLQFQFSLPDGVDEKNVIESRLNVTGYYSRYRNLMAQSK